MGSSRSSNDPGGRHRGSWLRRKAQPIYERYGQRHIGPPAPTRGGVAPNIHAVLKTDGRFANANVRQYDGDQTYSASDYRKLMLSYSDTQMMDESDRVALLDDIESFMNGEFSGRVTRPLVVSLTTAVLSER